MYVRGKSPINAWRCPPWPTLRSLYISLLFCQHLHIPLTLLPHCLSVHSLPLIYLLIDRSVSPASSRISPQFQFLLRYLQFIVPGSIRREVMMNGAALGQTAISSREGHIYLSHSSPRVPACVRRHWRDSNRASILINCARLLCKHHRCTGNCQSKQQLPTCSSTSLQQLFGTLEVEQQTLMKRSAANAAETKLSVVSNAAST